MTKVVSVHHFTKQDVIPLQESLPTGNYGICRGPNNLIFVVVEHRVDVLNLDDNGECVSSFPTVDLVYQVLYCEAENFVVTLEKKTNQIDEGYHVRVYLNWESCNPQQAMKARIAGCITPNCPIDDALEMVEICLPANVAICHLAICPTTGNILLGSRNRMFLYRVLHKTQDNMKFQYKDFRCALQMEVDVGIEEMCLCQNIVGYCSANGEVHVYQLEPKSVTPRKTTEPQPQITQETTKTVPESADKSNINFRMAENYFNVSEHLWSPSLLRDPAKELKEKDLLLFNSLVGTNNAEIQTSDLKLGGVGLRMTCESAFEAKLILNKKTDRLANDVPVLSNLHIIPLPKNDECKNGCEQNVSIFGPNSSEKGFSIFFNRQHIGYLYHVSVLKEGTRVVKGGLYRYTSAVRFVVLEAYLLHAFTDTGLESYTVRPHPRTLAHHSPTPTQMIVPPQWHETPLLVGLRPFLNIEALVITDHYLVLCAADRECEEECKATLYSLKLPTVLTFYDEMVRVASCYNTQSRSMYFQLLLEAHMVLCSHARPRHSSALLAHYFAGCATKLHWTQACQYYKASNLSIHSILERLPETCPGMLQILTCLWLDLDQSTPIDQAICIVDILKVNFPDKLSSVLLKSDFFHNLKDYLTVEISNETICADNNKSAEDILFLCLLQVDENNNIEKIISLIDSLDRDDVINVLVEHSDKLYTQHHDKIKLSAFATILARNVWTIFDATFKRLIASKLFSLDELTEAFMEVLPLVSCGSECNQNTIKLRNFIENILHEHRYSSQKLGESGAYSKSISILTSLYIASLLGAFSGEPNDDVVDWNSTPRLAYLNLLPPFKGHPPITAHQTHQCCCAACNIHLLRLQCLLCSDVVSESDRDVVSNFAKSQKDLKGHESLVCLCLSREAQENYVIENFPKALRSYCQNTYENHVEWKGLLGKIFKHHKSLCRESSKFAEIDQRLNYILDQLSTHLSVEEFLAVLPAEEHSLLKAKLDQCHSHQLYVEMTKKISLLADNLMKDLAK